MATFVLIMLAVLQVLVVYFITACYQPVAGIH